MKIQLSIEKLQYLINKAKAEKIKDDSLSGVLELELVNKSDSHLGDDHVAVWQQSSYAECNGKLIYCHFIPVK